MKIQDYIWLLSYWLHIKLINFDALLLQLNKDKLSGRSLRFLFGLFYFFQSLKLLSKIDPLARNS